MREDNIKDTKREKAIIKSRRMSIIGFIVAIALLTTAIVLAMNQEKAESLNSNNITISTNGKMGRNINEVRNELKLEAKKENAVSDSNSVDSKSASTDLSENNINNVNNVKQNDVISTNASSVSGKDGKNGKNKMADNKSVSLNNQNNQNNTTGQNNQNNQNKQNQSNTENNGDASKNANSTDSLIYSETLQEWVTHRGIDIKAEKGAEVKAIADGTIKSIKTDPRYGISIIIKHSKGFESVYACLLNEAQGLKEGDTIKQGQVIGNVGNSGVFESAEGMHLHFEMTKDGDYVNPE